MDLESIERCWREEFQTPSPRLEEGPVTRMISERASELRREVRRRLRREATYYLPMMFVSAASLAGGFTLSRALAAASVVLLLGGVMATLWWAERRILEAPVDLSLRESLAGLRSQVDAAGRAYLAVYVALFVVAALAAMGFVAWRHGFGGAFASAAAVSALAVLWSLRSGRAYVERMFRRDRSDLAECLRELERL